MTTATLTAGNRMMKAERPRRSLEELVDRVFAAMGFGEETEKAEASVTRSIHEARRLRQVGDTDSALDVLGGMDIAKAETREARWAFSEWKQLVKRGASGARGPCSTPRGRGLRLR